MKIGVLGASGALGRRTVDALVARGVPAEDVVGLVRSPEKLATHETRGGGVRRADYDDGESLKAAFQGLDRVLLVPSLSPPAPRAVQYANAISAALEAGVDHLYHYGLVPTRLEAQFLVTPFMLFAESALRTSGLKWTILRNSLYADPIADWVPDIVRMGTIPYPTGEGRCAYVSRDDLARAAAGALATEGHAGLTYNLTGPTALTTADLCDAVSEVTGQPVTAGDPSDEDYIQVCKESGESVFLTHALLTLYHTIRDGHCDVVTSDIERLSGAPASTFTAYLRSRGVGG